MIASRRPIPAHIVRPRPFPWGALPRHTRVEARLLSRVAASLAPERPEAGAWKAIDAALAGALGADGPRLEVGPPYLFPALELPARASALSAALVRVGRADGRGFLVAIDGALAARLAARVLGVPDRELAAPRAPTAAEKGVLAFLVAAALEARGATSFVVDGVFDEVDGVASLFAGQVVGVEAVLHAAETRGRVRFFLPEALLGGDDRPSDLERLWRLGHERLARTLARLEAIGGRARLPAREVAALAPRDVVLLDAWSVDATGEGTVRLACGRGAFAATLAGGKATITSPYETRGDPMSRSVDPALVEELPLELSCRLAEVTLSARDVLELAPGAIVPLGRPPGAGVELVSGGRVVARGELVEVEGELGVRITDVPR